MGRGESSQSSSKDSRRATTEGIKRKLRSVTRASASRELCHILPAKKPRRGFDGKFIRPIGRPPVEGFVWDPVVGYWIPRGAVRENISPPKLYESEASSDAGSSSDDEYESNLQLALAQSAELNKREIFTLFNPSPMSWKPTEPIPARAPVVPPLKVTKQKSGNDKQFTSATNHVDSTVARKTTKSDFALPVSPTITYNNTTVSREKSEKSKSKKNIVASERSKAPTPVAEPTRFHPDSMYQEPRPSDGTVLTLYERHRKPRLLPTGKNKCSIKALQQEFRCVICLGYIRNARVVKECLHRFCEQCIEKALLQVGKRNECPICRVFIPTRRSLAPDPNFDRLIQCILKNLVVEDDRQAEEIAARQAAESRARILQEVIRKKRQAVMEQRKLEQQKKGTDALQRDGDVAKSQAATADGTVAASINDPTVPPPEVPSQPTIHTIVKLVLRRHESEKNAQELQQPYLTISGSATVKLLRNFLEVKLGYPKLQVCTPMNEGKIFVYRDCKTLEEIATYAAKTNGIISGDYVPIHYRSAPKVTKTETSTTTTVKSPAVPSVTIK